jgi:hypothetical protein
MSTLDDSLEIVKLFRQLPQTVQILSLGWAIAHSGIPLEELIIKKEHKFPKRKQKKTA